MCCGVLFIFVSPQSLRNEPKEFTELEERFVGRSGLEKFPWPEAQNCLLSRNLTFQDDFQTINENQYFDIALADENILLSCEYWNYCRRLIVAVALFPF